MQKWMTIFLKYELNTWKIWLLSLIIIGLSVKLGFNQTLVGLATAGDASGPLELSLNLLSTISMFCTINLFGSQITEEIESQSIRFWLPYMKRRDFFLLRILLIFGYWMTVACVISLTHLLVGAELLAVVLALCKAAVFFAYVTGLTVLLCVVSKNVKTLMVLGTAVIFGLFIINAWEMINTSWLAKWVQWVGPFTYLDKQWEVIFLGMQAVLLFWVASKKFEEMAV
jgi:hypothetical protein